MRLKRTTASSVVAAAILLAACGGGEETEPLPDSGNNSSIVVTGYEEKVASVKRHVYALNPPDGVYGKKLREDGWIFEAASASEVPNAPETIVYVNAADTQMNPKSLTAFLKGFKGTLVMDSDKVVAPPTRTSPRVDAAPDGGEVVSAPPTEPDTVNTFYEAMNEGRGIGMLGTAMVRTAADRTIFGISFYSDGSVNGGTWDDFKKGGGLEVSAASNIHQAGSVASNTHTEGDARKSAQLLDTSKIDDRAAIHANLDGWWAIGYLEFAAFRNTAGQKYVQARVWTGEPGAECFVNLKRCGVYPQDSDSLAKITYVSALRLFAEGYAVAYHAQLSYNSATQGDPLLAYAPSAEAWNTTDAIQKDYQEKTWSEAFSVGGSLNLRTFHPGVSVAYSRSNVFYKRTDNWKGHGSVEERPLLSAPAISQMTVASGIELTDHNLREENGFWGRELIDKAVDIEFNKKRYLLEMMQRGSTCGKGKYVYKESGVTKPRLSYEGYRPGVSAVFKSTDNFFQQKIIRGSLKWWRAAAYYDFMGRAPCSALHAVANPYSVYGTYWLRQGRQYFISSPLDPHKADRKGYEVWADAYIPNGYFNLVN